MSTTDPKSNPSGDDATAQLRNQLAKTVLAVSGMAVVLLGVVAVARGDAKDAMQVFNTTLAVFSSWVGTVLAFYFGRENFEAANERVKSLVDRLSPDERASQPVSAVMRPASQTTSIQLTAAEGEAQWLLTALKAKFTGEVSRLPVLDADGRPLFILHGSTVDKYLSTDNQQRQTHTLQQLLDADDHRKALGPNRGFVLVSPTDSLDTAKSRMEAVSGCQDIFVTADGTASQRLAGWITNIRLAKFMQA
ncbi:hypothetical protein [Pseudaquabacterium pictum]|uniref:CBS domain-containing protein n=1 Tax=Pseudaquabacterium pictum TaxID=2315236 RepID=A0A480AYM1_9BURK|nr:hypothetical protein [Rubrivivax pictus]GCL65217.1 hypothetical protein AQPW35_42980 [Rubrivivax pictus]